MTQRIWEIVNLMASGYNNERISQILGISLGTAKNYICMIYSKLQVKNRQEAIFMIRGLNL